MGLFVSNKRHNRVRKNLEGAIATLTKQVKTLQDREEFIINAKDSAIRGQEKMDAMIKSLEKKIKDKDVEKEKVKRKFSGQYNVIRDIEKPVRDLMEIVNKFREQGNE